VTSSGLRIAFFGSSIVSAYWNGAATYYRGIIRGLAALGHSITFYEPDAYERQQHRDIADPPWCRVVVYPAGAPDGVRRCLDESAAADVIVKASGVGVFDELLEEAVLSTGRAGATRIFWDVDAPATLQRLAANPADPLAALAPRYDMVLTYGGGPPVVAAYSRLGVRLCVPVYNALDEDIHHRVEPDGRFACDLAFLGNRLPDREARVEEFFLKPAAGCGERAFLLGGSGWDDKPMPPNVRRAGHIYTRDHNAFNSTPLAVLNISRQSMADYGYSPATRIFEAAGAAACIITDHWQGLDEFLAPGQEALAARDGHEVLEHLRSLTPARARAIGESARRRVLREHTYSRRSAQVHGLLGGRTVSSAGRRRSPAPRPMKLVVLGLSITSSWGNGHATTYRGLLGAMAARGHDVLFLERNVPWYAANRDMPQPPFGRLGLYDSLDDLRDSYGPDVRDADWVIVGSYVPQGVEVGRWAVSTARGLVAFYDIDTPVTLAKLARKDFEYISPDLVARYHLYLSFTGGPTLAHIERTLGSPMARPLYCSADPTLHCPADAPPRWDLGYIGTFSPDRQRMLDALLIAPAGRWPQGRFVVAGPQYPPQVSWPGNIERIDHLPPREHCGFYNAQRFTLNLTRADMLGAGYSPSVRLFEAAACGTPIISDAWPGMEAFFHPGREILLAGEPAGVLRILREMSDDQRLSIAAAARKRVLAQHTCSRRAEELEGHLLDCMAASRSRPLSAPAA
jgi:spore maturation protein CgeB